MDRLSAVPIQDVCRLHPEAQIIAINVTGQPALYDSALPCPVLEVRIPRSGHSVKAVFASRKIFDAVVLSGYEHTLTALDR